YEGAPTSITAFMSAAVKAAAFAGLIRVFVIALAPAAPRWEVLWWVLAALSMILGNVVAIAQTSLKRMLAYSSISHAGYALIGVFLSLAVIPPTAGFVGKLLIFRAAIDSGFVVLAVIGVATSAIAAYYYFMVIKTMFMDAPTGATELSPSPPLTIGLAIMVVA